MAVPANPKMSQICAEFGAPANTPLSQFLRGGPWVPNTPTNAGVPTALPIRMSQLVGATAVEPLDFSFTGDNSATRFEPEPAPSSISMNVSQGTTVTGGTGTISYLWEYVSGSTAFGTASSTGSSRSWNANVPKNTLVSAVWRCRVTRGAESVTKNRTISCEYTTDL